MAELPFPEGFYALFSDDDDVIGLTVAKTYPSAWAIVRLRPPHMDSFDEFEVGKFLVECLGRHAEVAAFLDQLRATADGSPEPPEAE